MVKQVKRKLSKKVGETSDYSCTTGKVKLSDKLKKSAISNIKIYNINK